MAAAESRQSSSQRWLWALLGLGLLALVGLASSPDGPLAGVFSDPLGWFRGRARGLPAGLGGTSGGSRDAGLGADTFDPDLALLLELDQMIEARQAIPHVEHDPGFRALVARVGEELCTPIARATCAAEQRCGCGDVSDGEIACLRRVEQTCMDRSVPRLEFEQIPAFVMDEAALTELRTAALRRVAACQAPLVGFVPPIVEDVGVGEACSSFELPLHHRPVRRLTCRGGACRDGVCRAYVGAGRPCDEQLCTPPLDCARGFCEEIEHPRVDPRAEGCDCAAHQVCTEMFSYTCLPPLMLGEICDDAAEGPDCADGLYCAGGRCAQAAAEGPPCLDRDCVRGAVCAEGVCRVPVPVPARCETIHGRELCTTHGSCIDDRCGQGIGDFCSLGPHGPHCMVGRCSAGHCVLAEPADCGGVLCPLGGECEVEVTGARCVPTLCFEG